MVQVEYSHSQQNNAAQNYNNWGNVIKDQLYASYNEVSVKMIALLSMSQSYMHRGEAY